MILVKVHQVSYGNEIVDLVKVFFPGMEVRLAAGDTTDPEWELQIECGVVTEDHRSFSFYARIHGGGRDVSERRMKRSITESDLNAQNRGVKNGLKACVFLLLSAYTEKHPKWGILTGIRPTKIVHQMLDDDMSAETIDFELLQTYLLHPEKAALLKSTALLQRPYLSDRSNQTVSLYLHIPFCASKCLYCSFPSELIQRAEKYMDPYLDCLERELHATLRILYDQGTRIDTIYIGGGTPTVLGFQHLKRLLKMSHASVHMQSIIEYTVEAGRPDSLDGDKLALLREYAVTRLSINPQTMNQRTLDRIGRSHTVEDICRTYYQAREIGFHSLNMDVILGLPGENGEDLNHTMKEIAGLSPDNITIHTLAVKRASEMKDSFEQYHADREGLAEEMAAICRQWIDQIPMIPYYLYRQKYMLDHLENVGYTIPGKECLYNIQIMEEKRSIWALGAGAISKHYYPEEDRLERIPNVKNLGEYLRRIEEMIEKKKKILTNS